MNNVIVHEADTFTTFAKDRVSIDETATNEQNGKAWLWTFVAQAFTVFAVRATRAATALADLLTDAFQGVVNCDRAKMYWRVERLQWCWAHLKRDFQALYDHRDHLGTFLRVEGVEPTNNASERSLRHAVIWRKLSVGTQSSGGSRFVETMLTVIETCRQQKRNTFEFVTAAVPAHLSHQTPPSLLSTL